MSKCLTVFYNNNYELILFRIEKSDNVNFIYIIIVFNLSDQILVNLYANKIPITSNYNYRSITFRLNCYYFIIFSDFIIINLI